MSHTKLDTGFCDRLDIVASRVGIKVFRSEFETLETPPWKTIREEMRKSSALFLLVGNELVKAQSASETNLMEKEKWKFTQNWIAYEIGLACQLEMDVWVVCDSVNINFPVPYVNNYDIWGIQPTNKSSLNFYKFAFAEYCQGRPFPVDIIFTDLKGVEYSRTFTCPHCGAVFNFHSALPKDMETLCPSCLGNLKFPDGWLTQFR
jgi:hypothetical protein